MSKSGVLGWVAPSAESMAVPTASITIVCCGGPPDIVEAEYAETGK